MKNRLNRTTFLGNIILKVFFVAIISVFIVIPGFADNAVLQWDANSDADYYIVCWGNGSGEYTEGCSYDIPEEITTYLLKDSPDGKVYHYSVKAFNYCGNSSDFSEEIKTAHIPVDEHSPVGVNQQEYSVGLKSAFSFSEEESGGCFIGAVSVQL